MEDELIAQRDAAIAVTKELQRQLQLHRDVVERTVERRALNAERLRFHAEEQLRRAQDAREWEATMCSRLLYLSLFGGTCGAVAGWLGGLLVLVAFAQPLVGFLMVLPGMAFGALTGLAIAKTRIQLENRRRQAKRQKASRHAEVEMAVHGSVDQATDALDPLSGVASSVLDETVAATAEAEQPELSPRNQHAGQGQSRTWWGLGWSVATTSLRTSRDLATGLYHSTDYVRGVLANPTQDSDRKKEQ